MGAMQTPCIAKLACARVLSLDRAYVSFARLRFGSYTG
jgi:hypothetical protein